MNKESLRALLGDRPRFDVGVGSIGAPLRQFFMTGALHALKRKGVSAPRVLEIGSWIGFSTLTWARSMEHFFGGTGTIVCVDPWQDYSIRNAVHGAELVDAYRRMLTTGVTYDLFIHNTSFVSEGVKVVPFRGRSDTLLPLLQEGAFDLVFIDGDHAYDTVVRDIELSRPLVKQGGILCGDDLDLEFSQCDAEFARNNRDAQPAVDPRTGHDFHPGVTLAVHELIGTVSNYFGFWAVTVEEEGFTPLLLQGEPAMLPDHIDRESALAVREDLKKMGMLK